MVYNPFLLYHLIRYCHYCSSIVLSDPVGGPRNQKNCSSYLPQNPEQEMNCLRLNPRVYFSPNTNDLRLPLFPDHSVIFFVPEAAIPQNVTASTAVKSRSVRIPAF